MTPEKIHAVSGESENADVEKGPCKQTGNGGEDEEGPGGKTEGHVGGFYRTSQARQLLRRSSAILNQ